MDLPLSAIVDYLLYAIEQEKEQAAWELWTAMYPFMALEWLNPIKFDEFKNSLFKRQYRYSQKSDEEIVAEMLAVVAKHKGR